MLNNLTEIVFYKTILSVIILSFLFALFASIFHYLSPAPDNIDLILPPIMTLVFLSLIIALLIKPIWDIEIIMVAMFSVIMALTFTVWYFTMSSFLDENKKLVESLPPIASILIVISVINMILLRTRHALAISLITWGFVAIPVLAYLLWHPLEMWSPRGKDLMVTLGPALFLITLLLPFQRGLRKQVEKLKIEHKNLQVISEMDVLTQLYNRRAGERMLTQIMTEKNAVGLVMFDVDHFKKVNDTYGHPAGDKVLKELSKRCTEVIRKDGTLARWGGEEFIVILNEVDKDAAKHVAERLRLAINESPIEAVGTVSASFGVAQVKDFDTSESLLERADLALYEAKKAGRNCVVLAS